MYKLKRILHSDRGEITFFTCFFVLVAISLTAFLFLYASIQIGSINIRNGIKMELNNLSAAIFADTFHSQRETNYSDYISKLYSSTDFTRQLEEKVRDGLASKVELSNERHRISNIRLLFTQDGDRIEYTLTCDAEFYISMFGNSYPVITRVIRLTGSHNTKF